MPEWNVEVKLYRQGSITAPSFKAAVTEALAEFRTKPTNLEFRDSGYRAIARFPVDCPSQLEATEFAASLYRQLNEVFDDDVKVEDYDLVSTRSDFTELTTFQVHCADGETTAIRAVFFREEDGSYLFYANGRVIASFPLSVVRYVVRHDDKQDDA